MGPKKQPEPVPATSDPEEYTSHRNPEFEHLICVICEGVYSDPQQCASEHYFCRSCITNWITRSQTCPIDRCSLTIDDLRPAPRILNDMIQSLQIRCRFHTFGCEQTPAGHAALAQHVLVCDQRWLPLRDHDYCDRQPHPQPQPQPKQTADFRGPGHRMRKVEDWLMRETGTSGGDDRLYQRPAFNPRSCFW